jgi:hypothetical protein
MPDRQHLWRGIHDPEMTRRAIDVTLKLAPLGGGRHEAVASVRNSGAGHHFPTYMVPKVELVFYRRDAGGGRLELGRQIIGWQIDTPITREIADTRIPAGETREFRQPFVAPDGGGWHVELVMRVLPASTTSASTATASAAPASCRPPPCRCCGRRSQTPRRRAMSCCASRPARKTATRRLQIERLRAGTFIVQSALARDSILVVD